ncbi:hypothetical protein D3C81_1183670 [compost metagenome]
MDELVVTQVDPGVTDATTTTVGCEEQQVARLKLAARDQRSVHVDHFAGGARQVHARFFAEQVADETTAIEAGFRSAAETVTGTDQGHAAFEDAVGQDRKLVGLAASEVCEFFFGSQFFLEESGRLGGSRVLNLLLRSLLGHWSVGSATEQQGNECERHEGCEAI